MTPGTYLQKRRQAAGVSLADTEMLADLGAGELALIEAGERETTEETVDKLAQIFRFNRIIYRGLAAGRPMQVCRGCGCSTYDPCDDHGRGCAWVDRDMCSMCRRKGDA